MYKFQSKTGFKNFLAKHIPSLKRNFKPRELDKLEAIARYVQRDLRDLRADLEDPTITDYWKELYKGNTIRCVQLKMWDNVNTKGFGLDLISIEALENGEETKEHWYSATELAKELVAMETVPTREQIVNEMKTKLTWIHTTKEENQILKNNDQNYSLISALVDK